MMFYFIKNDTYDNFEQNQFIHVLTLKGIIFVFRKNKSITIILGKSGLKEIFDA